VPAAAVAPADVATGEASEGDEAPRTAPAMAAAAGRRK